MLSILSELHRCENKSPGVDVIKTRGMCFVPGGVLLPPALPSPLTLSHALSITHSPLGIPSSDENLKLALNVLNVPAEEN